MGPGCPPTAPEREGFFAERLNRINTVMTEHVQTGRLAGASGTDRAQRKNRFPE